MLADLRFSLRLFRKSPGFFFAAAGSIALGIGAATAVFTLANGVLLRSLPVARPDQLSVAGYVSKRGNVFDSFGTREFLALRERSGNLFTGLAGLAEAAGNLNAGDLTERVNVQLVTGNYFPLLGVRPALGRLLAEEDERAAQPVAVLHYAFWQSRFGGDRGIAGRTIRLNGVAFTVAGVLPEGFDSVSQGWRGDVHVPLTHAALFRSGPVDPKVQPPYLEWEDWMQLLARRRDGVSERQAEAELDAVFAGLRAKRNTVFEFSGQQGAAGDRDRFFLQPGRQGFQDVRQRYERALQVLLGIVGILLAVACANVANLLLALATGRRKETAVRLALGAPRGRLIRQHLAESLVIAAAGGSAGVLLAAWLAEVLVQLAPGNLALHTRPDGTVLAFAVAATLGASLLFGFFPALQSARTNLTEAIQQDAGSGRNPRFSLRNSLVVVQVALSVVLLAGAGLFLRTLWNLRGLDTGFDASRVVVASVNPGANGYTAQRANDLYSWLAERAAALPGVAAASAAQVTPLSGSLWVWTVDVPGYVKKPGETPLAHSNSVGPGYFATLGIPLAAGREFTDRDRTGSPWVAVINQRMAETYWPGRSPLGERIRVGRGPEPVEIVGVVRDSTYRDLREKKVPTVYMPLLQQESKSATILLRTQGDPAAAIGALRTELAQRDRNLPLYRVQTLAAQIGNTIARERLLATLSASFGFLATLLSAVGLYGVLAYAVARRSREIGIRMALGAERRDVTAIVLRDTAFLIGLGLALGLPAALAASRLLESFLYNVKPGDVATYAGIALVLAGVGVLAAWIPARRAARVDPMVALRHG